MNFIKRILLKSLFKEDIEHLKDEIDTALAESVSDAIYEYSEAKKRSLNRPSYTCPLIDKIQKHIGKAEFEAQEIQRKDCDLDDAKEHAEEIESLLSDLYVRLERLREMNEQLREEASDNFDTCIEMDNIITNTRDDINMILGSFGE